MTTPPLCCKPGPIYFRPLNLTTDLDLLHDWTNRPYSNRFWQMNGSKEALKITYEQLLENPHVHSFIGMLGDEPIAQIDCYQIIADELGNHIKDVSPNDCGLHLLMQPPHRSRKNRSLDLLTAFINWYFSHPLAGNLYAEPDEQNKPALTLAERAGFTRLGTIRLTYKTATLFCITRENQPILT